MTEVCIEKFEELLENYDWYYAMSDDHRIYLRGVAQTQEIQEYIELYPEVKYLYDNACKGKW